MGCDTAREKKYSYIPQFMENIRIQRKQLEYNLKFIPTIPRNHPSHIQATIGHVQPITTKEILQKNPPVFKHLTCLQLKTSNMFTTSIC